MMIGRRGVVTGMGAGLAGLAFGSRAWAQPVVDASAFGILPEDGGDQTGALQLAVDAAAAMGQPLYLPAGNYSAAGLSITAPLHLLGATGARLVLATQGAILTISDCRDVTIEGVVFDGGAGAASEAGLIDITNAEAVRIVHCRIENAPGIGLKAHATSGSIEACQFSDIGDTAIFSTDATGLDITDNRISDCGNGAIRVWRYESGPDGSRVHGNRIDAVDFRGGGNGENGNGINIFRADGVSVSDNVIADCAFSAIRLNATVNSRVVGNHCAGSGEIAIFSEFEFSGSVISDNIVDGAAGGISMTNWDRGGRMSICQGNIVRNIAERSLTNPDVSPYGIAAEADAIISGNIVEGVPGPGIVAGWGPFLRDVVVSDNLVRDCRVGIAVSVAPDAGSAKVSGNVIAGAGEAAIAGMRWAETATRDLAADAAAYPALSIGENLVQ